MNFLFRRQKQKDSSPHLKKVDSGLMFLDIPLILAVDFIFKKLAYFTLSTAGVYTIQVVVSEIRFCCLPQFCEFFCPLIKHRNSFSYSSFCFRPCFGATIKNACTQVALRLALSNAKEVAVVFVWVTVQTPGKDVQQSWRLISKHFWRTKPVVNSVSAKKLRWGHYKLYWKWRKIWRSTGLRSQCH